MSVKVMLRELRQSRSPRLSLNDLARLTGLSPQQIQRIEAGDSWFSRDSMEKICRALGCTPGELIDWEENEEIIKEIA